LLEIIIVMKYYFKTFLLIISLIIIIFLLLSSSYPALAGETVLNTALSVTVPEEQSGNPGDFLTYVLSFQNRANSPIDLQIEYLTESEWNIIGDSMVTVPANTKNYFFPLTIMIPQNAPADFKKFIGIRFKIYGEAFTLPIVNIPVFVNPVSTIDISTPASQNGLNGSTVEYRITATNSGNTTERFAVKGSSENEWLLEIEPTTFEINPDESRQILVKHQIPGFSETDYDQIKLIFSWGSQQKAVLLTTGIADKYDKMADRYYVWQGQASLSHPNILEPDLTDPNLSFSLSGDWKSGADFQFYFSDILNDLNRRYFSHITTDTWDVKAGDFSLPWQGLITPKNSLGNLRIAHTEGERSFGVYTWEPFERNGERAFGLEAFFNENSRISLLNEKTGRFDQNVLEWNYRSNFTSGQRWSNSLAYNTEDSNSYAYGFGFDRFKGNWYLTSNFQALNEISDYLAKKRLQLTLYQPFSNESMTIYNNFIYENRTLEDLNADQSTIIKDYDDYSFETLFYWPSGLNLRFSFQYQLDDGSFSKNNASLFIEDTFEIDRFNHEWWLSHSIDHSANDADSDYSKFNWETEYALNKNQDLILNPQLISNSISSENQSKLGFGFQQRLFHNSLEWKSLLFHHFSSETQFSLECSLDWRIYQYLLSLEYVGIQDNTDYYTDTFSLSIRKKFSIPVQKPLGTVEGIAFLDQNRNGVLDDDEHPLRKTIMILDGSTTFETDENGYYALHGLTPGEHQICLNSLYEVIYLPQTPVTLVTVKQYQTVRLDLPFIRSQNIAGILYFDQNKNGIQEPDEPNLSSIPINLTNSETGETFQTYSNHDGQFIFYQLAPGSYEFYFDDNLLPDNLQAPLRTDSIVIDAKNLEETALFNFGLLPFERPIEIVKEEAKLLLILEKELIKAGESLLITIESGVALKSLELQLPIGQNVLLETKNKKTWNYKWQIPVNITAGQFKIKCSGIDLEDTVHEEELLLVILK
jgi:hypothetical protein